MAKTKLILVEGIPGSGKSSLAQFIHTWLQQQGKSAQIYLEGNLDHPADYESVACLNDRQYQHVLNQFPQHTNLLHRHLQLKGTDHFFAYRKMLQADEEISMDIIHALAEYDIYDGLPADRYLQLAPQCWQEFVARASKSEDTFIFECCFLQNPSTVLLGRHFLPLETIENYILQLAGLLTPLIPAVIYLQTNNIPTTLQQIAAERPPAWRDFVGACFSEQGFGQSHNLQGYNSFVRFNEQRQALDLRLLPQCGLSHTILSDTHSWDQRHQSVIQFLETCL